MGFLVYYGSYTTYSTSKEAMLLLYLGLGRNAVTYISASVVL